MSINSLSGINNTTQSTGIKNASDKLQAAIASIVSGVSSDDVATVSVTSTLKSQSAGLRQAASGLAQANSQTQVADSGAQKIQEVLIKLQSLALQAKSPSTNSAQRAQLDQQFQELAHSINSLATSTTFNDVSLLDGSLSGDKALSIGAILNDKSSSDTTLSIGSLNTSTLFGANGLDILSANSADAALTVLGDAINTVISTRADIGSFQSAIDFAGANVDSALINQQAATASLSETDIADAATERSLADIQRNAAIALEAQGNKLSPALLKLIG